tara:strand:+ start:431 stop:1111 length:681 start_codon:yes stop_codon:yes gene_type:complete
MAKKHKSVRAAQEAGSIYFYDKNGTKKLAVTAEQLNAWKKKNKGKYKGSALTAWANNKGKDVGETGVTKSLRPKLRPKTKEAPKKKDAISDEQRSRQTTTPKRALNNSAMSPAQQVEKLQKDITQAQKDRADKRAAMQKGRDEADKILADTEPKSKPQISASAKSTRENEFERPLRVGKDSPRGTMLADDYYDAYRNGGMTKKKVMTYNLGGMVKSQTNNLKKGRS